MVYHDIKIIFKVDILFIYFFRIKIKNNKKGKKKKTGFL